MIDSSRDESRLAGVLERLAGRWRFMPPGPGSPTSPAPVDVAATNEALVLGGRRLDAFAGLAPADERVPALADLTRYAAPLSPERLAVVLLCGGLGSRSG